MSFEITAILIFILWLSGLSAMLYKGSHAFQKKLGEILVLCGIGLVMIYIVQLWVMLERAPLRTLGETRLWYTFFLAAIGMIIYYKWKMTWMVVYSTSLSSLFLVINLLHPENFDKTLMPALQSIWFVPHVIVYIFAYALLGASTLIAVKGLWLHLRKKEIDDIPDRADNIVYIGFSFLTFGLLFGALWAKEAWGSYWTWDPKETWAFITWMMYLLYIHFRYHKKKSSLTALWILALAFVFLMICWFGINYLPSAQNSVHVYSK
jgi:ABC-type transport system involved in cytochrome c biogenesis permease subunit